VEPRTTLSSTNASALLASAESAPTAERLIAMATAEGLAITHAISTHVDPLVTSLRPSGSH